ncbi:MAG TPA: hypothetical protein VH137_04635 [Gemmatimonadales bacterium]|nr:hypothetical protein [Gemmatimonadales bacterium]
MEAGGSPRLPVDGDRVRGADPRRVVLVHRSAHRAARARGAGSDAAYPALVTRLLPVGFKGLVLAGMLAALMSSLASAFNSCSTLLTWDVYRKLRPGASEQRLVAVGRATTVLLVGFGLLWIPLMKYISPHVYIYLQSVQAYIAPPIAACFLLGVLYPRLNGVGAVTALWTGLVIGLARLILELAKASLPSGSFWYAFANINFLHFAALLFALCAAILIGVSLVTAPPSAVHTAGLTYTYGAPEVTAIPVPAEPRRLNVTLSIVLAATLGVLWYVFR